jgi:hypothetical protein
VRAAGRAEAKDHPSTVPGSGACEPGPDIALVWRVAPTEATDGPVRRHTPSVL